MCGIAGAFSAQDTHAIVERMTTAIAHRGPDDEGFAELIGLDGAKRGGFGNRRLAILDLSMAGHQPMWSADGRFCLSYNGEIYNFRELRDELVREGARFESTGDSAVVLEGWARWGPKLLPRLRGMFAISLWDREAERGYLARDVFGIKPLYSSESRGAVLFASEIRALLASDRIPRAISPAALRSYLATGSVAEPLTIIDSIEAVPAGCFVTIDCRRGTPVLQKTERFGNAFAPNNAQQAAESGPSELRRVLRDSVLHHLVSDVPVALFLSGGIDSSSVVGVASEVSEARLDTFTVTFDDPDYSEAAPARAVAERFGTRHHEIPLTGNDLLDALPAAFSAMDQPSLDGLNTYVVSRAVRQNGIKVVLSGLGGDELFGGYPSFRRAALASRLWKFRGAARRILASGSAITRDPRLERLTGLFGDESPSRGAYRASRALFDDRQVQSLVAREARGNIPAGVPDDPDEAVLSLLQQVSLYETTGYMRNTLLRDSDVFSMAHGLELRVPFVDGAVARTAMSFPDSEKLSRGMSKPILVRAMQDLLPASLLTRPKQGFTLPFERWMRHELHAEIDAILTSPELSRVGLSSGATARIWSDFQNSRGSVTWSRPWALYTLKRWADQNDVVFGRASIPAAAAPASFAETR
jgi:asparagine synthase (glutamine-hydrolysing)